MGRVFANGPGDLGSIPAPVIPKTLTMVLDTSLLNTQQYKVRIKGKVEQSRERRSALLYTSESSGRPRLQSSTYLKLIVCWNWAGFHRKMFSFKLFWEWFRVMLIPFGVSVWSCFIHLSLCISIILMILSNILQRGETLKRVSWIWH